MTFIFRYRDEVNKTHFEIPLHLLSSIWPLCCCVMGECHYKRWKIHHKNIRIYLKVSKHFCQSEKVILTLFSTSEHLTVFVVCRLAFSSRLRWCQAEWPCWSPFSWWVSLWLLTWWWGWWWSPWWDYYHLHPRHGHHNHGDGAADEIIAMLMLITLFLVSVWIRSDNVSNITTP